MMKVHKKLSLIIFLLLLGSLTPVCGQIDDDLTDETKALYSNLVHIQKTDRFLFGQELFNSYRYDGNAHGDESFSDVHSVVGHHPAVLGSDFHYFLEKQPQERAWHTEAVKWAYRQGYVITFDWHISARGATSYKHSRATSALVGNIVNDVNGDRAWLIEQLDAIIQIINDELVVDGVRIPIVFRPWHEMNGAWFWWGSSGATAAQYKALYQLTVEYMKERTTSVLFCWSPNSPFGEERYPGDDYVDVVGVDLYEATIAKVRSELGKVVDFAEQHQKIAVFAETGDRKKGDNSPLYWNNIILPGMVGDPTKKAVRVAWVLTWISASWSSQYVPHSASPASVKQSFNTFKNSPHAVFGGEPEMPSMYKLNTLKK